MANSNDIDNIINRITSGEHTDADIAVLREMLSSGDRQAATQLGKYNINIEQGERIHIGDRIYNQWDKEAMEALVKAIQKTSGIHQNTQDGDVAARDINKGNSYENCTFIQVLFKDSNFGNRSQESLKDLDFSDIPDLSIQQAYQDVLPPDAIVWNSEANNITEILQKLEKFRRLFEFFNRLSQDKNIPQKIRDKLSYFAEGLPSKKHLDENKTKPTTSFLSNQEGQLESYLIATIERWDGGNEQFLLNAWLIIDGSVPVTDCSQFIPLLDNNEQQSGTLCKFHDVPKQLNKFLKTSQKHLIGKQYQLIIEVFLPIDLIGTEVDRWKISDPIVQEVTLGAEYPIRLRSLERLKPEYLYSHLHYWRESWDKVKTVLHKEPSQELFEHLKEIENFTWRSLKINLKEKIGIKVTCAPPKSKIKELFSAILKATTPIAIWTRCDIPNFDHVAAIDEILASKPLCYLYESVRQAREKADAQTEEDLGFHLALLWEDPHRLTPDVIPLTTTGQ